jgi:hypothetical protein
VTELPQLEIEAPAELASAKARLESINPEQFRDILELVGLASAGPAIKVVLVPEGTEAAGQVSDWVVGFAVGSQGLIVIFPKRSPSYPHNTLEGVLRHELTHVLISRASAGQRVPRWFNEGLAIVAERDWEFEDRTRLFLLLLLGSRRDFAAVDRMFGGHRTEQERAYALAGAFVRELLEESGKHAPGRILARVSRGVEFHTAFADVTGVSLAEAEARFWRGQRVWTTWVPIITSSAVVWMLITLLALFAIRRRRQKDQEIQKRWTDEEGDPAL